MQIQVTERRTDHVADGIDLDFHVGAVTDISLVARRILTYRHQLVASPAYVAGTPAPQRPRDLLDHRILAFSHWEPETRWTFAHVNGEDTETVAFLPHVGINDYAGVTVGLLDGRGIGDLPPIVQPGLIREGRLVEIMPDWRFPALDLSVVHLPSRRMMRPVRLFKEFSIRTIPTLFPDLPA